MMSAEGARMAETSGGLRKQSVQFTLAQMAWLQARARGRGRASVASILRELVDAAMRAECGDAPDVEAVA